MGKEEEPKIYEYGKPPRPDWLKKGESQPLPETSEIAPPKVKLRVGNPPIPEIRKR
jgi:hypothetical protein